jgi:hypothetical protein
MGGQVNGEMVFHCQDEIEPQRVQRDGQLDATLVEEFVVKAQAVFFFRHGLGRPVRQYQVVWSDKPIRFPAVARKADGNYENNEDQIGLVFAEDKITVRMRFA